MKIMCSKFHLLTGINTVLKAVPSRTAQPVLNCIFLEAEPGCVTLTANNLELGIKTQFHAVVSESGKIALNAKLFSDIVRKLPDNDVYIQTDEMRQTTIKCEKARFSIPGQSGEDFPALPDVEKEKAVSISELALKDVIRQTIFSVSNNDNAKLMTGELFEVKNGCLRVVSLDSHRISLRNVELKDCNEEVKVVIPGKTLSELSKILNGNENDNVQMYFTGQHVLFEFKETIVVSRLLDGDFYNIDPMLSSDYNTKIRINRSELLSCLDRATLFFKEADKHPIMIHTKDDSMYLSLTSMFGELKEEIFIKKEGKDQNIAFNPKYLMEVLRVIDDETVDLYMVGSKAPCQIKDVGSSYDYLVLPVNPHVSK